MLSVSVATELWCEYQVNQIFTITPLYDGANHSMTTSMHTRNVLIMLRYSSILSWLNYAFGCFPLCVCWAIRLSTFLHFQQVHSLHARNHSRNEWKLDLHSLNGKFSVSNFRQISLIAAMILYTLTSWLGE